MHSPRQISTEPPTPTLETSAPTRDPRRGRARWWFAAIAAALVIGAAAASAYLRSEALTRPRVEAALAALGDASNGRFAVAEIRAVGLAGLALDGLTFHAYQTPQPDETPLATVRRVVARPSLRALLRGDLVLDRVIVRDLRVTATLDSDGGALDAWIDQTARDLRARHTLDDDTGDARTLGAQTALPGVRLVGGYVTLDDVAGRYPSAGLRIDDVRFSPGAREPFEGALRVEGLGRALLTRGEDGGLRVDLPDATAVPGLVAYALPADDSATLGLSGVEVSWPPRVTVEDFELTGLGVSVPTSEGVELRAGAVDRLSVTLDTWGLHVDLEGLEATMREGEQRTELVLAALELSHAWDARETHASGTLHDRDRDALLFEVTQRGGGEVVSAELEGERVDLARLSRLLPLPEGVRVDAGTFDVDASLQWSGLSGVLSGSGALDARYVRLHAPALSSSTLVGAQGRLAGRFSYLPDTGTLVLDEVDFGIAPLGLRLQGAANLNPERIQLSARGGMPAHEADTLVAALPDGLLSALDGLRAEGAIGFDLALALDSDRPEEARVDFALIDEGFRVLHFPESAPVDQLSSAFTMEVTGPEGAARAFGPTEGSWVTLSELPAHAYLAVLAAEDDAFWRHTGFDDRAIARAMEANLAERRIIRGGSTITQQLVKNLFLEHERTVSRKLQEAFLTWQIERHVPKARLLELYLNLVQWGPEVYGLADAAVAYFGRPVDQLEPLESVYLAAILPNPTLYAEHYVRGDIPASRVTKMQNILRNLNRGGFLSDDVTAEALRRVRAQDISDTPPPRVLGEHEVLLYVDSETGPPVAAAGP